MRTGWNHPQVPCWWMLCLPSSQVQAYWICSRLCLSRRPMLAVIATIGPFCRSEDRCDTRESSKAPWLCALRWPELHRGTRQRNSHAGARGKQEPPVAVAVGERRRPKGECSPSATGAVWQSQRPPEARGCRQRARRPAGCCVFYVLERRRLRAADAHCFCRPRSPRGKEGRHPRPPRS